MALVNAVGVVSFPLVAISASRTFAINDANTFFRCTGATAFVLTVPTDASVPFSIGAEMHVTQDGTGAITINGATGCNVRRQGSTATTGHILLGQYAVAVLKKVAANEWRLYGGISF